MKTIKKGGTISVVETTDGKALYKEYEVRAVSRIKRYNPMKSEPETATMVTTTNGLLYTLSDSDFDEERKCWEWKFETEEGGSGIVRVF